MPIHDWTRVSSGTFHDFHCTWIPEIKNRLNRGILPPDYYAQVEQVMGGSIADVLTLRSEANAADRGTGGTAVALAPPKVRFTASLETEIYSARARRVAIRHASDDHIVALIEVVSPGNKSNRRALREFSEKVVAILAQGCHLLIIDLLPPSQRDPQGIHGVLWGQLGDDSYEAPSDKPLTLAAYSAGWPKTAYVEPVAVGDRLIPMPLFLTAGSYVSVPLEESYGAAYAGVPRRWREVLDRSFPPGSGSRSSRLSQRRRRRK